MATATLTLTPIPTATATTTVTTTATLSPASTATTTASPTPTATPEYHVFLPWLARLPGVAPDQPSLAVAALSRDQFQATWSQAAGATAYRLLRGDSPDLSQAEAVFVGNRGVQETTLTLPPGRHYLALQALNLWGAATSAWQGVDVVPPSPTPTPEPPAFYADIKGSIHYRVIATGGTRPVVGAQVLLRFYDGANTTTVATATSNQFGGYAFYHIRQLEDARQYYTVVFPNAERNPLLAGAYMKPVGSFNYWREVFVGAMEVTNLPLVGPVPGKDVWLPEPFSWRARDNNEDYALRLMETVDNPRVWQSPYYKYAERITLNDLPDNAPYGRDYLWTAPFRWHTSASRDPLPTDTAGLPFETWRIRIAGRDSGGEDRPVITSVERVVTPPDAWRWLEQMARAAPIPLTDVVVDAAIETPAP